MRIILLIVLAALMQAAGTFAPSPGTGSGAAGTALAFGYLLLSAFFAGDLCESLRLPRLTGYILAGIAAGPSVLNLVTTVTTANLRIFNGIAIALIALTAGVELDLREMRPLFRSIGWQIVIAVLGTAVILAVTVFFARGWIQFMKGMDPAQTFAVALVLGVTMVAQSPAVVVALRAELAADGPLTRTVLGVVVVSDLVVVLLFALVSSIAKTLFGAPADAIQTALSLTWQLGGSMLIGSLVGAIVFVYLRFIKAQSSLFIIVVGFIVAEVGQRVELDPLIVALAAGLLVRNLTPLGPQLLAAVEGAALPVYVVFFAVTGATLRLADLLVIGPAALLFAVVRAGGFAAGSWGAARLAQAPDVVRRFAAFGLIPQAGLALALALLLARTFPTFGNAASSLIVAMVAINQIVAPVLFRMALVKSGETRSGSTTLRASEPARTQSPIPAAIAPTDS
jgi:Kef-type K+ transport system membrane component KefB